MTTQYFNLKTSTQKFVDDFWWTLGEIANRKVILYGSIDVFEKLKEKFQLDKLNIVGISKHEFIKNTPEKYGDFKAYSPFDLNLLDFEVILVLSENPIDDREFLCLDAGVSHKDIKFVFNSLLPDECELCNYLENISFSKSLGKLAVKLYGKKVIIYGAGKLFDVINRYYNLSCLNIVGICDERFDNHYDNDNYYGYKMYSIEELKKSDADCVLVATRDYIKVMEELVYGTLKNTGVLIKPLARKSFFDVLKEIWS